MPRTVNGSADVTITKKTGTVLTVLTNEKYCDENHAFNLTVQQGTGAANSASADVDAVTTAGSAGGTNVSDILGTKTGTEPSSGYYVRMNASGSGSSKITGAGWMDEGNLAPASAQETKYFPVAAGGVTQNAPTIDTSTGIVTAEVSTTAGYVPTDAEADSNTLQLTTQAGTTITPTRSQQTAVAAGKYTLGDVVVGPIPNTYYTLPEVFPVNSFYSNTSGTNPSITLGFGTWELIRSVPYRWLDVSNNTWYEINDDSKWSFDDKVTDTVYVFQRTA